MVGPHISFIIAIMAINKDIGIELTFLLPCVIALLYYSKLLLRVAFIASIISRLSQSAFCLQLRAVLKNIFPEWRVICLSFLLHI